MIRASLLALGFFLLLPSFARADNFHVLNGNTIFQGRNYVYRVRGISKPLQRAEQGGLGGPSLQVGQTLFMFFDGRLFRSIDGLAYSDENIGAISQPHFFERSGRYFLFGGTNGVGQIWELDDNVWYPTVGPVLPVSLVDAQVASNGAVISLLLEEAGEAHGYELSNNSWQLRSTTPCPGSVRFIAEPVVAVFCGDGSALRFEGGRFAQLLPEPATLSISGPELIVAQSIVEPSRLLLLDPTTSHAITLPILEPVTAMFVVGKRILIAFSPSGLHELDWRPANPTLTLITRQFTAVVPIRSARESIAISAHPYSYISAGPGLWRQVTSVGEFNQGEQLSTGLWVWQTNAGLTSGGLAQFLNSGSEAFVKVNPWSSTTSPIQRTYLEKLPAYVSVVTSSGTGNVNLYRSLDYLTWTRLTLPTEPTLIRSIRDVRALPAGSLIETRGTVTAPVGVVGADLIYIQEDNAGIQIFLSAGKGQLSWPSKAMLRVTGEVSGSATSRIILGSADDAESLNQTNEVAARPIMLPDLDLAQGQLVLVRELVSELSTDSLQLTGGVKAHFEILAQNIKTLFRVGDTVEFAAIADWNSATDSVELWYADRGYQLIARALTPVKTSAKSATKSAAAKVRTTQAGMGVTAKVAVSPPPKKATLQPLVQGVQNVEDHQQNTEGNHNSTTILTFLGVVAGMLTVQGRRFRRLIR